MDKTQHTPMAGVHTRHSAHAAAALQPAALAMRHALIATAIAAALLPWPHVARAQAASSAAVAAAPVAIGTAPQKHLPIAWISYEDTSYTPVVDDVSAQLAAARAALAAHDKDKAAASLRAAAQALQGQADKLGQIERRRAAADMNLAQDTHARMNALVSKLDVAAAQIQSGQVLTTAQLDKTIDKAGRADLERRWLVSDVTSWYPVAGEPQRLFGEAAEQYAHQSYRAAATSLRQASAYLRLESARVTGDAKASLDAADAKLNKTARALDKGGVKSAAELDKVFAQADHALALAHRSRAAEAWAHKAYERTGYELKAAAQDLEGAAGWIGREAAGAASALGADAREVGDKLASGGVWARDEVSHGFESLRTALNHVGHSIGVKNKAAPFDASA